MLKVIWQNIQGFLHSNEVRIEVFGILIVPLIYGGIYLAAFWDPYGSTEVLQVAVVNEDVGINDDDDGYTNYGKEILEGLENNDDLDWRFVDTEEEAREGMDTGDYYAAIVIPEDFSSMIDGISHGENQRPDVKYLSNDKKNFIVSLVTAKAADKLDATINQSIDSAIIAELGDGLETIREGMVQAGDGATQIAEGVGDLKNQVPKLADGVSDLADGVDQFSDSMDDAADGAKTLEDGIGVINDKIPQLQDGVQQLEDGSATFNDKMDDVGDGVNDINDAVATIKDTIPEFQDGAQQLDDGAGRLYTGAKQLNEATPDLIDGINDLNDGAEDLKDGMDDALDGMEDVYSGIIINEQLLEPIYDQLGDELDTMESNMSAMASTLTEIYSYYATQDGYSAVSDGLYEILEGISDLNDSLNGDVDADEFLDELGDMTIAEYLQEKLGDMQDGVDSIAYVLENTPDQSGNNATYAATLEYISQELDGTIDELGEDDATYLNLLVVEQIQSQLSEGSVDLLDGMKQLDDGASDMYDGTDELADNVPDLVDATEQIEEGGQDLQIGIQSLESSIPTLANGANQLYDGTSTLTANMSKLEDAASDMNDGISELNSQIPTLKEGVDQLDSGSQDLAVGMDKLNDAAETIKSGTDAIEQKIPDLEDGVNTLYDGSLVLADSLNDGAADLADQTQMDSKDLASFGEEPTEVTEEHTFTVNNYGEGLTPYFVSLSLWVGGLVMFVIFSSKKPNEVVGSEFSYVLGKYLVYGFLGTLQAVMLSAVTLKLGLNPVNVPLYFAFNILLSWCFMAILMFLNFLGGNVGRLLSMVMLILQLTSANGTFPVALEPKFFQDINKYMPFQYSISGIKELISGYTDGILKNDAIVLATIMLAMIILTCIVYKLMNLFKKEKGMKEVVE